MKRDNVFFGWFDDADQTRPSHDPPHDAPCPLCGCRVSKDDVRTHSLMPTGVYARRSYFYRTHRRCAETFGTEASDGFILDMIKRRGE